MPIEFVWADPVSYERPPHFPDPNADPIALLEAALAEKDEIIAAQYREMKAWQAQLGDALDVVSRLEGEVQAERRANDQMYLKIINNFSLRMLKKLGVSAPVRVPSSIFGDS